MMPRLLRFAPWWCAALHAIAAVGTVTLLRGGSEAVADPEQRIRWLAEHPWSWRAGWLLWMVAAVSLLMFYAWWARKVPSRAGPVALTIAAAGLVADFSGELIFIAAIPDPGSSLHRTASLLTGGLGNGLYTLAGAVLTVVTPAMTPLLRGWAWLVWATGFALSGATIAGAPAAVVVSSALLMVLFIPFVLLAGLRLR